MQCVEFCQVHDDHPFLDGPWNEDAVSWTSLVSHGSLQSDGGFFSADDVAADFRAVVPFGDYTADGSVTVHREDAMEYLCQLSDSSWLYRRFSGEMRSSIGRAVCLSCPDRGSSGAGESSDALRSQHAAGTSGMRTSWLSMWRRGKSVSMSPQRRSVGYDPSLCDDLSGRYLLMDAPLRRMAFASILVRCEQIGDFVLSRYVILITVTTLEGNLVVCTSFFPHPAL